ncbi:hypothetical protein [Paenibacillus illinoisensis]|uniref:Lipoprotein n=1 Tax=Paenibacillus illinoisensis TaxID=59845 RepID=A0A2W0CBE9_9BACL|nr:hypothetical protein [Paenibacillus illinoisensis]PYY25665.1 hypothetical protein PIL02S_06467 [Paenibacillus illinoisensis]
MNKTKMIFLISTMLLMFLISACGNKFSSSPAESNTNTSNETKQDNNQVTDKGKENTEENAETSNGIQGTTENEILIIIDQTEKPTTGNSFDFSIKKAPKGYSLTEMHWLSKQSEIKNTVQEAIEHGQNGEDGFYISGNGQYSGFIYSDNMKGEQGQVVFYFGDEEGNELTWKKYLTLSGSADEE